MLLSLQKKNKKNNKITNKQTNIQSNKTNKPTTKHTKQQQHIVAPVYITDGDAIRQLL